MADTGWKLPTGYTEVSGSPWTTPANIETETVDYASKAIAAKNTTYELAGTNFGFSTAVLPDTSVIDTVNVRFRSYDGHATRCTTGGVPYIGATGGTPHTHQVTSPTTLSWDATNERPGGGSWQPSDFRDGTLTVRCQAIQGNSTTSYTYNFDFVEVQVLFHATDALTATAELAVGSPAIGSAGLGTLHNLQATAELAIGSPAIGSATIGQAHKFTGDSFANPAPLPGAPALGDIYNLAAPAMAAPAPALDTPQLAEQLSFPLVLSDDAIDLGIAAFTLADKILVCSDRPTSYAQATALALGGRTFAPGGAFGSVQDYAGGRSIASTAFTDGQASVEGAPVCWAAVDSANSRLLASGPMNGAIPMGVGQGFGLDSFTINLPGA